MMIVIHVISVLLSCRIIILDHRQHKKASQYAKTATNYSYIEPAGSWHIYRRRSMKNWDGAGWCIRDDMDSAGWCGIRADERWLDHRRQWWDGGMSRDEGKAWGWAGKPFIVMCYHASSIIVFVSSSQRKLSLHGSTYYLPPSWIECHLSAALYSSLICEAQHKHPWS